MVAATFAEISCIKIFYLQNVFMQCVRLKGKAQLEELRYVNSFTRTLKTIAKNLEKHN